MGNGQLTYSVSLQHKNYAHHNMGDNFQLVLSEPSASNDKLNGLSVANFQ